MKELTYYEAVEKGGSIKSSILLDNPRAKEEKMRWCRFKTLEGAKQAVEKAINQRKHQYEYFRDMKTGNLVDKISYYDRYDLEFKIYKIVQQEEVVYTIDNHDEPKREPNKELRGEMPL